MKTVTKFLAAIIMAVLLTTGFTPVPGVSFTAVQAKTCPVGHVVREGGCYHPVKKTYYNGTGGAVKTVRVTFCLPADIHRTITRPNGTNEWVVHYHYKGGAYERIVTERNKRCDTRNVAPGTKVAVYVTCKSYTGWVATTTITGAGSYTMHRVSWTMPHK